jgi:serine/threonine protein kinase
MSKIGHFEILSELAKSATGAVYKANDPQTSQTVALKAIQLSAFGAHAGELEKSLLEEVEATKVLSNPNLTPVYGAGEIEGQFCAAMEYVQGNSVATMQSRKEGFSIWDLLDIGRQVCSGLDHAHSHNVFHYSLEPAKIMCGWDGTVRVLGFGLSSVGKFTAQMPGVPTILNYMSPEQVRGESIDARSNLFSVGALFYEMVTDHKPFQGTDAESLRQSILQGAPVPPVQLNQKLHPGLSDLILKALAKNPAERYGSGRELLDDLEKCKESKPQAKTAAAPAKAATAAAPAKVSAPVVAQAAGQQKFAAVAPTPAAKRPPMAQPTAAPKPTAQSVPASPAIARKAAAAEAGSVTKSTSPNPDLETFSQPSATRTRNPEASHSESMSQVVLDEPAADAPRIAVDPMMAEGGPSPGGSISFSEMTELPPLKEVYISKPSPAPVAEQMPAPTFTNNGDTDKEKVSHREVAEKAIKEIKSVPPSLMVYSLAGAAVLILIIAIGLVLHINHLNSDDDAPRSVAAEPTSKPSSLPGAGVQPEQSLQAVAVEPATAVVEEPAPARAAAKGRSGRKRASAPAAPVIVPGQLAIDSTPQGAQVQLDGKSDSAWVTPFTLSGINPGQHTITVSKAGYASDTRSVDVASGSKSFFTGHLAQLMATLAVSSTPAGANVYIDSKDTGKLTPAQVSVDKGQHVVLVRKAGFLDETTSAQFVLAQTVSFSPTLRELGNVDDIKTVGKMNKLFGSKLAPGMGLITVRTQPKGAQVAVNKHMLERSSPVDAQLDPGNYIVDITLTGYAPIHKVVTVDKGGKAVIDEVLQHE